MGSAKPTGHDAREGRLNNLTHAPTGYEDPDLVGGSALFGASLVALYTVSAIYHGLRSPC
ncbi:hypothetical protein [Thiohalorhabdus sp.]|uniref:hypothetical protein n=1 Tax=Thiohalorhabdus sp. TaxID=3094134 RepID=UPI002FC350EB